MALFIVVVLLLPIFAPSFYTYVFALVMVNGLLAMSLNLVLGYGGLYQFHHGVFYGIGAYAIALILTKSPVPWWLAFIAAPIIAALFGLVIGWICIRSTQLYFGMLQISLGSLVWIITSRWYDFTGGDNGINNIPMPSFLTSGKEIYYFILAVLAVSIAVMYRVVKSPFGATLQAIRDNPQRCEAIGVNVRHHQLIAIVIASFFAGVAGVLYVGLERSVFPDMLFWVLSLEVFVMCLLGGWFTFAGPLVGAGIIVILRTFVSIYTEYWTMIEGIILILLIFFLPQGVVGFALGRVGRKAQAAEETVQVSERGAKV